MNSYPYATPKTQPVDINTFPGLHSPVEDCSAIELAFRNAEGQTEELMKSVSLLTARIQPVLRQPSGSEGKAGDRPAILVPVAERIQKLADTIRGQLEQITELATRVEI